MPLLTLLNSSSSSLSGDLTLSRTVIVVPTQTYSISMWFDPSNVTNNNVSPQMQMGILTADGLTTISSMYLPLNCTVGRYTLPNWTCPTNVAPHSDDLSGQWVLGTFSKGTGGPSGATDAELTGTGSSQGNPILHGAVAITPGLSYTLSAYIDVSKQTGGSARMLFGDVTGFGQFGNQTSLTIGAAAGRSAVSTTLPPANLLPDPSNAWTFANGASLNTTSLSTGGVGTYPSVAIPAGSASTASATAPAVSVTAGSVLSLSAICYSCANITSGSMTLTAIDQNGTIVPGFSISWTSASAIRSKIVNFTVPNGVTSMRIVCSANGATLGSTIYFSGVMLIARSTDPGGWLSQSNPQVDLIALQGIGAVITSGQKILASQPMLEQSSSSSGYYISSQTPQVVIYGKLLASATVTSGTSFKISQPMVQLV